KQQRTDVMLAIASRSARQFRERFLGQTMPVLFEGRAGQPGQVARWVGLTDNYLRVRVQDDATLANQVVATRLDSLADDAIDGTLVEPVPRLPYTTAEPGRNTWRIMLTSVSR